MLKKLLLFFTMSLFAAQAFAQNNINGAGATFPYAAYSAWAYGYNAETKTRVNYQGIGSGGGIKQILAKTVDFGASDEPMSSQELEKNGLIQFPAIIGGVVLVVNIDGVAENGLTLTPDIIAGIFMGKITKWSDPEIASVNKELKLPDAKITVVHRSDSSGTTAMFTNYLARASEEWAAKMGKGKTVNWTTGVGGKGNDGVAGYVKQIKNSIGYVEFAYANQNKIAYTKIVNKAGKAVSPTMETFSAAASGAKWDRTAGYSLWMTNSDGDDSWPIAGASFILLRKDSPEKSKNAFKFFDWSFSKGDETAKKLFYVPLPEGLKNDIRDYVSKNIK